MPSITVDVLSTDGDSIVNQILIDSAANPADFGGVARVAPDSSIGWVKIGGAWGLPLAPAPTQAELQAYAGAKAQKLLAAMRSYTSGTATLKSDATSATIADLMALAQWGAANVSASQNWVANDYSVTAINGAGFVALAPEVGAYALSVYAELAGVLGAVAAGTITTTAAIDAYAWTAQP